MYLNILFKDVKIFISIKIWEFEIEAERKKLKLVFEVENANINKRVQEQWLCIWDFNKKFEGITLRKCLFCRYISSLNFEIKNFIAGYTTLE